MSIYAFLNPLAIVPIASSIVCASWERTSLLSHSPLTLDIDSIIGSSVEYGGISYAMLSAAAIESE